MEKDKLEIVLADMFDELKILNNNMAEQKRQVAQLQEKISDSKEKASRLNEAA